MQRSLGAVIISTSLGAYSKEFAVLHNLAHQGAYIKNGRIVHFGYWFEIFIKVNEKGVHLSIRACVRAWLILHDEQAINKQ